jgi:hypothetical protein
MEVDRRAAQKKDRAEQRAEHRPETAGTQHRVEDRNREQDQPANA